jgi:hypothetical protein
MKKIAILATLIAAYCGKTPLPTTANNADYSINGKSYVATTKTIQHSNGASFYIFTSTIDQSNFSLFSIMVKNDSATITGNQTINSVTSNFSPFRIMKGNISYFFNVKKRIVRTANGATINDTFITYKANDTTAYRLIVNTTI